MLRVIYFLTCPISTLVYLSVTRGIRGIGWGVVHAVGMYATMLVAYFATFYLLYFTGLWDLTNPIFFEE